MLLDNAIGGMYKTTVPTRVRERVDDDSITEEEFENDKDKEQSPTKIEGVVTITITRKHRHIQKYFTGSFS